MMALRRSERVFVSLLVGTALSSCGIGASVGVAQSTCPSLPSSAEATIGMLEYRNAIVGWSIQYPSDWTVNDQNPSDVAFISPAQGYGADAVQENLSVEVVPQKRPITLKELMTAPPKVPVGVRNYQEPSSHKTTAGALSYPAWETQFKYTYNGVPIEGLETAIILPNEATETARLLTYTASPDSYDPTLPTAQAMIDSFKIG